MKINDCSRQIIQQLNPPINNPLQPKEISQNYKTFKSRKNKNKKPLMSDIYS